MTDFAYTLIYLYAVLAMLSLLVSPAQVVAVLEARKADDYYPYGYLLQWAVYTVTLAGVLTFLVQKASARG